MLDILKKAGLDVIGVGKISDIFAGRGLTENLGVNLDNDDGMAKTEACADRDFCGLCFVNLVDFDEKYGHRNDVDGYARAVVRFDDWLAGFLPRLKAGDALMITAAIPPRRAPTIRGKMCRCSFFLPTLRAPTSV